MRKKIINSALITLGTISLALGVIGVFIPGLPTTPFLLLTAGLYIRSSEKLYNRLISDQYIGGYIDNYYRQRGMTLIQKLSSMSIMWIMIFISCRFFIDNEVVKIIVITLGVIGTTVMGFIVPTSHKNK